MVCVWGRKWVCVACRARATGTWEEIWGWVGAFVCVYVCEEENHRCSHHCAPIFAIIDRCSHIHSFGGENGRSQWERFQERKVLILSWEGFPSSYIKAKTSLSLFFISPLFFIIHGWSWTLATDASPSKQDEQYLTFHMHFCPLKLAGTEETLNVKLSSPSEQMSQWGKPSLFCVHGCAFILWMVVKMKIIDANVQIQYKANVATKGRFSFRSSSLNLDPPVKSFLEFLAICFFFLLMWSRRETHFCLQHLHHNPVTA